MSIINPVIWHIPLVPLCWNIDPVFWLGKRFNISHYDAFTISHWTVLVRYLMPMQSINWKDIFYGPDDSGSDITQTVHACHFGEIWNKVDIFWLSMTLWLDRLNSYKMRLRERRRHCPSPARSPGHTDGRTTSCLIPWQPGILLRRLLYLSLKQKINVLSFKLISFYRIIYDNLIS